MEKENENGEIKKNEENCRELVREEASLQVVINLPKIPLDTVDDCHKKETLHSVNLSWHGLSYVVRRKIKKEYISILKNVTGEAKAGEMKAILGPSGAGKTTLLNILVGLIQKQVEGKIIVAGKERNLKSFRNLICFIQQQNEILPDLTLKEALTVAANLKLDRNISREGRCKIIKESLKFWGLSDCKDTLVQKLSGGQRKRLSIAQEVINKPPVIFLDEPTSGLDSMSCMKCISLLRNLAQQGHSVICSIHQPTALTFEQFDSVCFLTEGQCLYDGPRNDLLPFLCSCGLECPIHHNLADFVIEAAVGEYGEGKTQQLILSNAERHVKSLTAYSCDYDSNSDDPLHMKNKSRVNGNSNNTDKTCTETLLYSDVDTSPTQEHPTSSWNQFLVLFGRAVTTSVRSRVIIHTILLSHAFVAISIGLVFFGIGNDASKILDNTSSLFFSMIFVSFSATMGTVLTFPVEMPAIRREIFNRWYAVKAYYLARTLADIPLQIILPIAFGSVVYWMTGQANEFARFVLFLCILVETALISQTIGLCLGAICQMQVAVFLGPVGMLLPPLLFCGFFIRLSILPSYMGWISYLSFYRYSFQGILLANYGFNRTSLECSKERCQFENLDDFLEDMSIKDTSFIVCFCVLLAFVVVFRFLAFFLLKWKTTKSL